MNRILIVDDDEVIRQILAKALEKLDTSSTSPWTVAKGQKNSALAVLT
jgi:CheY-like chemotaxis protein